MRPDVCNSTIIQITKVRNPLTTLPAYITLPLIIRYAGWTGEATPSADSPGPVESF